VSPSPVNRVANASVFVKFTGVFPIGGVLMKKFLWEQVIPRILALLTAVTIADAIGSII
jgi:hypothetical protein